MGAAILGADVTTVFTPSSISGLVLWLKADTGTFQNTGLTTQASADTDPVGGWKDQSGVGNNLVQATAGKRPLLKLAIQNGLPVVRTDGLTQFLQASFTLNQPFHLLLVYRSLVIGAAAVADVLLDGGTTSVRILTDTTPRTIINAGSSLVYAANICNNVFGQITVVFNGGSGVLRENGTQRAAGAVGANNPSGFTLGSDRTGARNTNVDFGEVLIYNRVLTASEQSNIEAYLKTRWATP